MTRIASHAPRRAPASTKTRGFISENYTPALKYSRPAAEKDGLCVPDRQTRNPSATQARAPVLSVFAIETRDFACRLPIYGAFLQIGSLVTRFFALPYT